MASDGGAGGALQQAGLQCHEIARNRRVRVHQSIPNDWITMEYNHFIATTLGNDANEDSLAVDFAGKARNVFVLPECVR